MGPMDLGVRKMQNKVLIVCLGNICRSPALEIALKKELADRHVSDIHVESRGLSEKQRGKPIDERVAREMERRGYTVPKSKVSIPVLEEDFFQFDYMIAADNAVLAILRSKKPHDAHPVIELASYWSSSEIKEIPDPYHAPNELTTTCVDLVEQYAREIADFFSKKNHPN